MCFYVVHVRSLNVYCSCSIFEGRLNHRLFIEILPKPVILSVFLAEAVLLTLIDPTPVQEQSQATVAVKPLTVPTPVPPSMVPVPVK